jgi:G3E family GTPase
MKPKRFGGIEVDKPTVILVGGFLGAGKTTLLAAVAERLTGQGKRVGLITNDQAANLVDTAALEDEGSTVEEVSGGCFCCRFDEFVGAMDRLVNTGQTDVLLGEPVGSCTDLSATVMQPIKALHPDRYRLAPSSVLVDPDRVRPLLVSSLSTPALQLFPANVLYIYRKQLEEADLIVLNKIDLLSGEERQRIEDGLRELFPRSQVMSVSARDETGVDAWLETVTGSHEAGRTLTDVDYDVYARGRGGPRLAQRRLRVPRPLGGRLGGICTKAHGSAAASVPCRGCGNHPSQDPPEGRTEHRRRQPDDEPG